MHYLIGAQNLLLKVGFNISIEISRAETKLTHGIAFGSKEVRNYVVYNIGAEIYIFRLRSVKIGWKKPGFFSAAVYCLEKSEISFFSRQYRTFWLFFPGTTLLGR